MTTILTNQRPIPRTRYPQRLTLNLPPTMHAKTSEPDPVHRVRALVAPIPAQVQRDRKINR